MGLANPLNLRVVCNADYYASLATGGCAYVSVVAL